VRLRLTTLMAMTVTRAALAMTPMTLHDLRRWAAKLLPRYQSYNLPIANQYSLAWTLVQPHSATHGQAWECHNFWTRFLASKADCSISVWFVD
jgi:hypothetical protein